MATFVTSLRREAFSCPVNRATLEHDLQNLEKIYTCGAYEAVVFYSARILEAILKSAHAQFFGEDNDPGAKQPNLADIEGKLYAYNLLPGSKYYWAKGLRLLGNDARHSLRRVTVEEADCALIFLEFILNWYFCDFPLGYRHTSIYKGQGSVSRMAGCHLLDLAWTLDSSRLNPEKLKVIFGSHEQKYLQSFSKNFVFPLLLIEIFTAQGDHASANKLIESSHEFVSRSKGALKNRYYQLKGLLLSRDHRLEEALQILEREHNRQKNDRQVKVEDETAGILGGVYKRIWESGNNQAFLSKSYETYQSGWRRSKNAYLGINAATTALWLSNLTESRQIAGEVKGILNRRRTLIQQKTGSRFDLNYWDLVTLAEANLLLGNIGEAEKLYGYAVTSHGKQPEHIKVTRNQLSRILQSLSLETADVERFKALMSN